MIKRGFVKISSSSTMAMAKKSFGSMTSMFSKKKKEEEP
jgi:hypothetical protein